MCVCPCVVSCCFCCCCCFVRFGVSCMFRQACFNFGLRVFIYVFQGKFKAVWMYVVFAYVDNFDGFEMCFSMCVHASNRFPTIVHCGLVCVFFSECLFVLLLVSNVLCDMLVHF